MKRYKNFLIVEIDHGYGNIKTANTVTPTGITKLNVAPIFTKNTLYFDGSYYLVGEGHKEYLPDKWEDNDNCLFTLMGIARELNREGITTTDVHLAVGLPLTWVNRQREERFVEQIVSEVGKAFISEMPKFLVSLMLSLNTRYPIPTPQQSVFVGTENISNDEDGDDTDYSDIDLDFIGG